MAATATKKSVARSHRPSTNGHDPVSASTVAPVVANGNGNGRDLCRTTAVFPTVLNINWELYALQKGLPKNEVLIVALREYLIAQGFEPDKMPKFDVSWHD
jgi:hypothetical protein